MPTSDPEYAVVEMLCDASRLGELKAIPTLQIEVRPLRTDDPARIRIYGLADEAAQAAAAALGCTVTVVKSAEDHRAQIEEVYRTIGKKPDAESGPA